jgi:acid phosphatase type 7
MIRALLLVLAAAHVAVAQPVVVDKDAPPVITGGVSLVRSDTAWRYQTFSAPAIAPQIGAVAASSLDVATGRATAPIDVLGDDVAPPAGWPYDLDRPVRGSGKLEPAAAADSRIAAMFAITTFSLGTEHSGLRVIEIRLRYQDGVVIWLNGLEVARRSLDGPPRALAARPHGPEWETFYVPAAPTLLRLGENVLAIEVHPSGRRDSPTLAADVVGRRDLGIVRGPIVSDIGPTSAVISVETDASLGATLEWGSGDALDHTIASDPGRIHAFTLTGLPPNAKLSYRVRAGGAQTPTYKLRTSPAASDVVRIGVYGDVRGGHDIHRRLVEAMLGEALDIITVTGDMVLRGSDEADWQRFFAITRELLAQIRYIPAIGNHDLGWNRADPDVFALPAGPAGRPDHTYWYSLDLADVHLVFLDSNAYDRVEQERWLDADLAAARTRRARAIIAFTHDGPYSRGSHRGNTVARDRFVPILARHHVDLLLAGHDHIYQRGEHGGIRYIVSGGGGAGLYKPSCGVSGKSACPDDGMQKLLSEHHYIVLTLDRDVLEMCPRKPDGRLLEKCQRYSLWRP